MNFAGDVLRFTERVKGLNRQVFTGTVTEVHGSVTEGSPLTGAPGQPVDTTNLIRSFGPTFPAPLVGDVVTNVEYAPAIEDGEVQPHTRQAHTRGPFTRGDGVLVREHQVRAHEVAGYTFSQPYRGGGGPHSVKLTRAGWDRIVDHVVARVTG